MYSVEQLSRCDLLRLSPSLGDSSRVMSDETPILLAARIASSLRGAGDGGVVYGRLRCRSPLSHEENFSRVSRERQTPSREERAPFSFRVSRLSSGPRAFATRGGRRRSAFPGDGRHLRLRSPLSHDRFFFGASFLPSFPRAWALELPAADSVPLATQPEEVLPFSHRSIRWALQKT